MLNEKFNISYFDNKMSREIIFVDNTDEITRNKNEVKDVGKIRVGKIKYSKGGQIIPTYEGFTPIIVLTKSSQYGMLGPYVLKDEHGRIMENVWQFSKVYKNIPYSRQTYSRYDNRVVWNWPAEEHVKENKEDKENIDGKLTDKYFKWRQTGMNATDPIRYPVGMNHRKECIGALLDKDVGELQNDTSLNLNDKLIPYIESRKQIYFPLYCRLVKQQPKFALLQKRLQKGENLLIIEVDVAYDDMPYYKETYNVADDFIINDTMLFTKENMKIVLNDKKYPCGHGYGLAMALMGVDEQWLSEL